MTLVPILGYIAVASVACDSNSFKMCRSAMLEQYLWSKIAK